MKTFEFVQSCQKGENCPLSSKHLIF